ncbi:MAG: hypothetical protein EOO15_18360 [Chitinophagaceae bacterium]|nr:MAG: hypothetical protein EOO15_18360 [Chitinophagaceae bacterium]
MSVLLGLSRRSLARILTALVFLLALFQLLSYYQARTQLTNPLIPEPIVHTVADPHLLAARLLALFGAAALLLLFRKRYVAVIVLGAMAVLLHDLGAFSALYTRLLP